MVIEYGAPFTGEKLRQVRSFLKSGGLSYEEGIQFTVIFVENDTIIATGSLEENVIKCMLVDREHRGEDLSSALLTQLISHAFRLGRNHLFLYTAPKNKEFFHRQGFYPIAQTEQVLLLENTENGIRNFVKKLACPTRSGNIGCVVCNCNPLTNGHLFLIQTAARQCDLLHVFILSEDRSAFPADVRYRLVKDGISFLRNVVVHPTSDYLISTATFPSYFLKDRSKAEGVGFELDFTVFQRYFAAELNIISRFVGSEPYNSVMALYNSEMKKFFSGSDIEIIEIPRCIYQDAAISASHVRCLLAAGDNAAVRALVPPVTFRFLQTPRGQELVKKIKLEGRR